MSATVDSISIQVVADDGPDTSYLEQEEFEDRLEEYQRGDFGFVGVQLVAVLRIPHGNGWITQTITTPGLWGIEDDSREDYFRSVAADEMETLRELLGELGVDTANLPAIEESFSYA